MRSTSPRFWLNAPAFLLLLAACAPVRRVMGPGDPRFGVELTWHGHSCFSLEDGEGRTVVIDPYDESVGYPRLKLFADALLITHSHFDHAERQAVRARLRELSIVESTGPATVAEGLTVVGIPAFHDDAGGAVHGAVRLFSFYMGGLRFAHLSDIGQAELTPLQLGMLGPVDVLFVPVGGVTTVGAEGAARLVRQIAPRIVIPMHYGDLRFYRFSAVEPFLARFPADTVRVVDAAEIRLRPSELPVRTTVIRLTPPGGLSLE